MEPAKLRFFLIALHRQFWNAQPALLFALSLSIGTSGYLFWDFPWNWIFPFFWSLYLIAIQMQPLILFLLGAALYSFFLYSSPPQASREKVYFSIASVQPHQSPFHRGFLYRGTLYIGQKRIPGSVYFAKEKRPIANCDYLLYGKLIERGPWDYAFKAKKWTPVAKSWSLAEFRYQMKERLRQLLTTKMNTRRTASFLSALLTGDVEERSLRYEFGRLGLQHILAISGFHFGLLAFCSFSLSLFLPKTWRLIFLLAALNGYFLFVGSSPAVQRSWLTAQFYLIGKLMGRHASGRNLLGAALLIEVISDPLVSAHIGFQLSFLSSGGILLLHPFFEKWLRKFFPKRSSAESEKLSFLSKHASLLSGILRHAISLTLAVNLTIAPLLLYHFHTFPYLSLLYNLFFPLFVSGALFSLLLSLLVHLIFPPLASLLFQITDLFTKELLTLSAYPPLALDYSLRVYEFSATLIPFYLFFLFCLSLKLREAEV